MLCVKRAARKLIITEACFIAYMTAIVNDAHVGYICNVLESARAANYALYMMQREQA